MRASLRIDNGENGRERNTVLSLLSFRTAVSMILILLFAYRRLSSNHGGLISLVSAVTSKYPCK